MHELSTQTPQPWYSVRNSVNAKTAEEAEALNIGKMNQNQILRAVAQMRIEKFTSLREAAESLGIDIRTLQRHAQWNESGVEN